MVFHANGYGKTPVCDGAISCCGLDSTNSSGEFDAANSIRCDRNLIVVNERLWWGQILNADQTEVAHFGPTPVLAKTRNRHDLNSQSSLVSPELFGTIALRTLTWEIAVELWLPTQQGHSVCLSEANQLHFETRALWYFE